jgi:hypothetical protein
MSTLSVSSITGVTNVTGSIFDAMGTTANNANATAIAAFAKANAANISAGAAFDAANAANSTATSAGVPTGGIIYWASSTAPTGFLRCDGNIYLRSTYSSLASLIGTPPMPSSISFDYANSFNSGATGVNWPILVSANNLLIMSIPTGQTGNGSATGNLHTSTDGITWTPRNGAQIRQGGAITGGSNSFRDAARMVNDSWGTSNGASGPYVIYVGGYPEGNVLAYQTSTDQGATWTQRTLRYYRPTTSNQVYASGFVSGGTQNAYLAGVGIYSSTGGCGCSTLTVTGQDANVAWSADGITFTAFKSFFPAGTYNGAGATAPTLPIIPIMGSSSNGFVVLLGFSPQTLGLYTGESQYLGYLNGANSGLVFWSANGHPSTWTDITTNLRNTISGTSTPNLSPVFANVFSCNNEIIIPTVGNKFLVSSNGANGTWRVVDIESGLGAAGVGYNGYNYFRDSNYPYGAGYNGNYTGGGGIIRHNGDMYYFIDNNGTFYYSRDLRVWWKKDDIKNPFYQSSLGRVASMQFLVPLPNLKKIVMVNRYLGGIFSFTSNGNYTAATQFPVPEIGAELGAKVFSTSAVPLRAFIKT